MIDFGCSVCGKKYSVSEDFAGRTTTCRVCRLPLTVPTPPPLAKIRIDLSPPKIPVATFAPAISGPVPPKLPMRTRRLLADANQMRNAFHEFDPIRVKTISGDPPDLYQVDYRIRGLARGPGVRPVFRDQHLVEIQLTRDYPRQSPKCKILTPIFHPNFDPTTICVGDHWTAGERLVDLVIRIAEMIAYQAYNIKSPLDGEAAMWADLNRQELPTDNRDLRPPNLE